MDDKKINSHLILLLTVSIAGVVVAAAGRWIALGKGADAGTANLIFLIICGIAVVVYLILVTTLFHLFAPFFAKLQAKRKPTVIVLENTSEPEPELKPFEELPTLTPIEEIKVAVCINIRIISRKFGIFGCRVFSICSCWTPMTFE